jgi:hypothetical protein
VAGGSYRTVDIALPVAQPNKVEAIIAMAQAVIRSMTDVRFSLPFLLFIVGQVLRGSAEYGADK